VTIENGLAALEAQTSSRARRQPAPRHPKREVEVPPPPASAPVKAPTNGHTAAVVDLRQDVELQSQPAAHVPKTDSAALRPTQVHLDPASQEFLRRCGAAGLLEGSRDVTMSGVIRFALAQLAATKTPEEVAKSMLAGDTALRRPGRRRL
jgi:hypothetical protein